MRFHFILDGLGSEQASSLIAIESAMNGRSATAVFNLKTLDVCANRDPEKAKAFVLGKLGGFLTDSLEPLMAVTGLDMLNLYRVIKGVPVVLTGRRK